MENRNPDEKSTPSQPNLYAAGIASCSDKRAPPEQSLKHDLTGRAYGHAATQHKIQMRVGLRFIVHLSKDFLTLCQTPNPTIDEFQYVGVGVGEQRVGERFFTQVYVDTLDVVVLIPEACFTGE